MASDRSYALRRYTERRSAAAIRFVRGRLTALLDFDLVHRDPRAVDIACSLALDCLQPPAYDAIDPVAVRAFVSGYLSETSLSDRELRLIVPLIRAWILSLVAFRLTEWAMGSQARALRSVERSVSRRFPSLDRRSIAIENAVQAAADGAGREQGMPLCEPPPSCPPC